MGLVIRRAEGQGPGLDGRDKAEKWSEEPLGSCQDLQGGRKEGSLEISEEMCERTANGEVGVVDKESEREEDQNSQRVRGDWSGLGTRLKKLGCVQPGGV